MLALIAQTYLFDKSIPVTTGHVGIIIGIVMMWHFLSKPSECVGVFFKKKDKGMNKPSYFGYALGASVAFLGVLFPFLQFGTGIIWGYFVCIPVAEFIQNRRSKSKGQRYG